MPIRLPWPPVPFGVDLASWLPWAVVALGVTFVGLTKSGFGAGLGLMVVPMTAIALGYTGYGAAAALGLLLPLLIVGDTVALAQYRREFDRQALRRLLPATAVGVVVAGVLLWWIKEQRALVEALMRIEIGAESVLLVALHWWRTWRGTPRRLWPEPWRGAVAGGFSALSSTLAHAAGPIIAMYLLPRDLGRRAYVGTCATYFFLLNCAKLPAYAASGQFGRIDWAVTAALVPLVFVGALVGRWLNRRMSDRLFLRLVYGVTFVLGWFLLIDGGAKLLARLSPGGG